MARRHKGKHGELQLLNASTAGSLLPAKSRPEHEDMADGYLLKAENIVKTFSGIKALGGVNLSVKRGEIHCLAGENGCGKSTLIKIISGVYKADSGRIIIDNHAYESLNTIESIRNGVQVIYQDFSIFPNLTAAENIAINYELAENQRRVNWKKVRTIAKTSLDRIKVNIPLDIEAERLSVADKQLVAISRALLNEAKLIIMDEPTSALTQREIENMFTVIRSLKKEGISILFVSHKLDEVFAISDSITIFRNGKNIKSAPAEEFDKSKLIYYMTGREIGEEKFTAGNRIAVPVMELKKLELKSAFSDVNFSLYPGEILGITGLLGSGRTELALTLAGYYKPSSGEIIIKGKKAIVRNISDAMDYGIAYVPEDRLTEGLFLDQSIARNIIVATLEQYSNKAGVLSKMNIRAAVKNWVDKLLIKTDNPENPVRTLSGGNQQRVVLAKWLAMQPAILILNGPTSGVDVGSKADIHLLMRNLADSGVAIILISDDIPEILNNSSRLLIMEEGHITGEFDCQDLTEEQLNLRFRSKGGVL
jgi:simple sugar transport system ATP-binding protein